MEASKGTGTCYLTQAWEAAELGHRLNACLPSPTPVLWKQMGTRTQPHSGNAGCGIFPRLRGPYRRGFPGTPVHVGNTAGGPGNRLRQVPSHTAPPCRDSCSTLRPGWRLSPTGPPQEGPEPLPPDPSASYSCGERGWSAHGLPWLSCPSSASPCHSCRLL